eukprot:scpid35919/ scgid19195/ 
MDVFLYPSNITGGTVVKPCPMQTTVTDDVPLQVQNSWHGCARATRTAREQHHTTTTTSDTSQTRANGAVEQLRRRRSTPSMANGPGQATAPLRALDDDATQSLHPATNLLFSNGLSFAWPSR